jgi:hypothetical protein
VELALVVPLIDAVILLVDLNLLHDFPELVVRHGWGWRKVVC